MKKMMRIAAGLAALALVAVMAGCKGKEKSNVAAEIVGTWRCTVTHEVPEGFEYMGEIHYSSGEAFTYDFETDGSYYYEEMAVGRASIDRHGTYSVNAKQGKIKLKDSEGYDAGTLEIKGDTLVDGAGDVFTKGQYYKK